MKIDAPDIDTLKQGVARSREPAFRQLFDHFYPRLLHYAFVIIKNQPVAEDVALEVLYRLWERRDKIMEIKSLENYLYVSARNKCLDHHNKNSRLVNINLDEPCFEEFVTHHDPEQAMMDKELAQAIDMAVLALPEKTRLVYRLVKEDGLKYQEVADLMGTSVKTVNNQLVSAVRAVREAVAKYLSHNDRGNQLHILKSILFFFGI